MYTKCYNSAKLQKFGVIIAKNQKNNAFDNS